MMSEASGSELRQSQRVSLKVEIGIHSETNFYTGFSVNVSSGGIFVATHVPARVGERIPLSFTLPNRPRPIEATGVVCWFREYNPLYPDTHPGMGLRFVELSEEDEQVINEYLHNIREPYFHPGDDE